MANEPAQNEETKDEVVATPPPAKKTGKVSPKLSLEGIDESTPQYRHIKRLIDEEAARKRRSVPAERYIEILRMPTHHKGDKVRLVTRMEDWKDANGNIVRKGNLHRVYLGRSSQLKGVLQKYKEQGLKVRYF